MMAPIELDDYRPLWQYSPMRCLACQKLWIGVHMNTTTQLQCPECLVMADLFNTNHAKEVETYDNF